jgi:hypothetical protein
MRRVDGWKSLADKPSDQITDLAARYGNLVTLEIASKSIPTQIATAPSVGTEPSPSIWRWRNASKICSRSAALDLLDAVVEVKFACDTFLDFVVIGVADQRIDGTDVEVDV